MHGKTIIKSLGTTVSSEAFNFVRSQAAISFRKRDDRQMCIYEIISEMQFVANKQDPQTIGDMVSAYLAGMTDDARVRFAKKIERDIRGY